MRIPLFSWLFLMPICLLSISFCIPAVSGQCLGNQQSLLLQLKSSLAFDNRRSTKLVYWNQSVDCCLWEGVTCTQGRVIGLDLSYESIYGGLDFNSSSLFGLQHLQHLNLAYNDFSHRRIPSQFDKLKNLSYLNLSTAGFTGQIPIEISHLTRLVTLDLSTSFDFPPPLFLSVPFYIRPHRSLIFNSLKLENPNLNMLVQNLSELMGLYLDGVNISAQGSEWSEALSSSLPNLRVLSMSNCSLSGPLNSSLLNLQFLSIIRLDNNNFSGPVPESFGDFKNLTSLCFSSSGLNGKFPEKIFQIPTLQKLDLSSNELLQGSLPEFPLDGSLRTLMLSHTNFAGTLPSSIGNLKMLSLIDLMGCNFSGKIPNSLANLTQLYYLDMSSNNFNGSIPSLSMGKNLIQIFLSNNDLTGPITSTRWEELLNLEILNLSHNSLEGSIPVSLFSLPSLQDLTLRNNRFFGPLNEFPNVSSNLLNTLDLSFNYLTGPIPMSIFELQDLERLLLSSNNLEGPIPMSIFEPSELTDLDLSHNQILGKIPNWIWKLQNLYTLNLSYNYLVTLDFPLLSISSLSVLDLRFNQLQLQGQLLIAPSSATYLDFSMNNFSGIIPASFGYSLVSTSFLSLSSNEFNGSIPGSICNAKHLLVLDLSNNSLSGTVPQCLIEMSVTQRVLGVLNLRNNNLTGAIYDVFGEYCGFETLDLSGNQLEGKLPKSLAMCKQLEVLNIGNNHIKDAFPCYLKNIIMLRVLVLRSNEFYGLVGCPGPNVTWPMLQIIDLASNNFTGRLPKQFFSNWSAMVAHEDTSQFELIHHDFHPFFSHVSFTTEKTQTYKEFRSTSIYYQDGVTITAKGLSMELVKILIIFTSIDLSCNNFVGPIPEEIGELKFLHMLNLSHNAFTGQIPSSLGKISNLESLDLSNNELIGEIPVQLADGLTFLSFLNLSFNQLVGNIPQVKQFATFSETSYEGNTGLYGCPLKENCTHGEPRSTPPSIEETPSNSGNAIDWSLISVELGFVFGFATIVGPLLFWKKWRIYYYKHADDIFFKMFPKLYIRIENRRKRAHKNQGRRAH